MKRPQIVASSDLIKFLGQADLMAQLPQAGWPVGLVGGFPALQVSMTDPRSGPFSSAVRRCPVWPRSLLYVAEVALKLQVSPTSTGGFLRVRFGKAESVPAWGVALLRGISTRAVVSTTCSCITCVLTT